MKRAAVNVNTALLPPAAKIWNIPIPLTQGLSKFHSNYKNTKYACTVQAIYQEIFYSRNLSTRQIFYLFFPTNVRDVARNFTLQWVKSTAILYILIYYWIFQKRLKMCSKSDSCPGQSTLKELHSTGRYYFLIKLNLEFGNPCSCCAKDCGSDNHKKHGG